MSGNDEALAQPMTPPLAAAGTRGTGHTSPIAPGGEWRLVFQPHSDPHPGEWVETNHPAVVDAMGAEPPCQENGCQLDAQRLANATLRAENARLEKMRLRCGETAFALVDELKSHGLTFEKWDYATKEAFARMVIDDSPPTEDDLKWAREILEAQSGGQTDAQG